jgi:SAM-dependent methyltransferase
MSVDVTELMRFYDSPLGRVAARFLGRTIQEMWVDIGGRRLLGIGYAIPVLGEIGSGCERVLAVMPPTQGVRHWPAGPVSATAMADPLILPLPEASFDRVLVMHAMESSQDPGELMDEVARILVPDGRALFVCPNRRGLWARIDTTPFGHGQPFSRKQIRRLLQATQLEACAWRETLYMPPFQSGFVLGGAATWETVGRGLSLPFAGLYLVETVKRLHRPIAVKARRHRRRREPVLVPVPASRIAAPQVTSESLCDAGNRRQ